MNGWLNKLAGPAEPRLVALRHHALFRTLVAVDDRTVLLGDDEGGLCEWRAEEETVLVPLPGPGPEASVLGLACRGNRVAVLYADQTLYVGARAPEVLQWKGPIRLPGFPAFWSFVPGSPERFLAVTRQGHCLLHEPSESVADLTVAHAVKDSAVCCAASVPREEALLLGCADGTVRLWSWRDGAAARRIAQGDPSPVLALQVLSGGYWVAGHESGRLYFWSPSGQVLAAAGADGDPAVLTLAVLDGLLGVASGHRGAAAPESKNAFAGQVRVTSLFGDGPALASVDLHSDSVLLLEAVPAGRLLSAGADGCVRLWDVSADPRARWPLCLARHDQPVRSLLRLPGGRVLSTAGRTLKCWVPPGGVDPPPDEWRRRPCRLTPAGEFLDASALPPDGHWLCGPESLPADQARLHLAGDDRVEAVETPGDAKEWLIAAYRSGKVQVLDLRSGTIRVAFEIKSAIRAFASFSSSSFPIRLAVGDPEGRVGLWTPEAGFAAAIVLLRGPVNAVAFLSGDRVVAAGEDGGIRVIGADGRKIAAWTAPEPVVALAVDLPQNVILAGLRSRRVLTFLLESWDAKTAKVGFPLPSLPERPESKLNTRQHVWVVFLVPPLRRVGLHGQGTGEKPPELPRTQWHDRGDGKVKTSVYLDDDGRVAVEVRTNAPSLFGAKIAIAAAAADSDPRKGAVVLRAAPEGDVASGRWVVPDDGLYSRRFEISFGIPSERSSPP